MAYVNLWELITTIASRDESNQDKCIAIQEACARKRAFGSELSLEVDENGVWTIRVFSHGCDDPQNIELVIKPDGSLSVTRSRASGDVYEIRTLKF